MISLKQDNSSLSKNNRPRSCFSIRLLRSAYWNVTWLFQLHSLIPEMDVCCVTGLGLHLVYSCPIMQATTSAAKGKIDFFLSLYWSIWSRHQRNLKILKSIVVSLWRRLTVIHISRYEWHEIVATAPGLYIQKTWKNVTWTSLFILRLILMNMSL